MELRIDSWRASPWSQGLPYLIERPVSPAGGRATGAWEDSCPGGKYATQLAQSLGIQILASPPRLATS